jgi:hypothetical protein
MPIIATASESKNYTPAPEGTHHAVCVDVIDKGMQPNKFKDGALQHKIDVAWQLSETRDDGKRFVVYKRYTLSLNEKANLRKDLESWRGKPFTREEEMGFDVEKLIGVNCLLNVVHKQNADKTKTFANVVSVMPLLKGLPKIAPDGYERHEAAAPEHQDEPQEAVSVEELTDDDIPF